MNALTEFLSGFPHILPPPNGHIAQVIMLVAFVVPIAINVCKAFVDFVNRPPVGVSQSARKPHEWITEPAPTRKSPEELRAERESDCERRKAEEEIESWGIQR